jgi:hypothetical protein
MSSSEAYDTSLHHEAVEERVEEEWGNAYHQNEEIEKNEVAKIGVNLDRQVTSSTRTHFKSQDEPKVFVFCNCGFSYHFYIRNQSNRMTKFQCLPLCLSILM